MHSFIHQPDEKLHRALCYAASSPFVVAQKGLGMLVTCVPEAERAGAQLSFGCEPFLEAHVYIDPSAKMPLFLIRSFDFRTTVLLCCMY